MNFHPEVVNASPNGRASDLATSVVGCIGSNRFATAALERLHCVIPLGAWTVYRLRADAPPEMPIAATRGRLDVTGTCWAQYRSGLYHSDRSFDGVRAGAEGAIALTRIRPSQLTPAHRAAIYDQHHIQQRLSLVTLERPGVLLALNFYRFAGQGWFSSQEENDLVSVASILVTGVQRHLELGTALSERSTKSTPQELELAVLRERCPRLTERELEVCMGLVQGCSFDGIAARLNVSATTVKTYRDRAFRRLGINHRNQLYGVCVAGMVEKTSRPRSQDV